MNQINVHDLALWLADTARPAPLLLDVREPWEVQTAALKKVEAISEEGWTKENFKVELTKALTAIENARMEWNGARLKFPVLSAPVKEPAEAQAASPVISPFTGKSFPELCRLGLALTWPLAVIALAALALLAVVLTRH